MSIHLRNGSPSDHAMMAEIWEAAWSETYPGVNFSQRRTLVEEQLRKAETGRYRLRVAEMSGARVGFTLVEKHSGILEIIAVLPARWGDGVSKLLIEDAKSQSRGHLTLFVGQGNPRAVRFYHKEGFKIVGEGTSPYSGLPTFRMDWDGSPLMP